MKTTVEIADALFEEAKAYASSHGLTFRQLLEMGLRQAMRADRGRLHSFRLRKRPFRGRGLASDAEWATARARIYEERGA